jgi:hypothetical protein
VNKIRKRLTYANVMSSIAVFLVLGGATAIAAGLAKNSVGSKQLKKNAVTTAKIKNNAVTGAKIKNGAITGSKVDVASLGTVPNATHANSADTAKAADTATSANTAGSAGNANTVGGLTVKKFYFSTNSNPAEQTVLSIGSLSIVASCSAATLEAVARTSVDDATIHSAGVILGNTAFYSEEDEFDTNETFGFLDGSDADSNQGSFSYTTPGGSVTTVTFASEEEDQDDKDCSLWGTATAG